MDVKKLSVVVEQKGIAPTAKNLERLAKAADGAKSPVERLSSTLGGFKAVNLEAFSKTLQDTSQAIKDVKASTSGMADMAKNIGGLSVNLTNIANATDRLSAKTANIAEYVAQLKIMRTELEGMKGLSANIGGTSTRGTRGVSKSQGSPTYDPNPTNALTAAQQRLMTQLERTALMVGKTKSEYLAARAAQLGLTDSAAPFIDKIKSGEKAMNGMTISTRQANAALRMVPAQFTDIVTQLAGGQNPMLVLMQQGGQMRDMFQGFGNMFKAVGPMILRFLTNPLVLAGAALGTLGYAFYNAGAELRDFHKALASTGSVSGMTENQFQSLRESISSVSNITGGEATKAVIAFSKSSKLMGADLEAIGTAAIKMSKVTGESIEDQIKNFENLRGDIRGKLTETLVELNNKYNFLTKEVYDNIVALEKNGQTAEAVAVAQKALTSAADEMYESARKNQGWLEASWDAVANAVIRAKDAILDIGRQSDAKDLKNITSDLARARINLEVARGEWDADSLDGKFKISQIEEEIAALTQAKNTIEQKIKTEQSAAKVAAENQKEATKYASANEAIRKRELEGITKQEKRLKAISDLKKQYEEAGRNTKTDPSYAKELTNIEEKFKDRDAARTQKQFDSRAKERAAIEGSIEALEKELEAVEQNGVAYQKSGQYAVQAAKWWAVYNNKGVSETERRAALEKAMLAERADSLQQQIKDKKAEVQVTAMVNTETQKNADIIANAKAAYDLERESIMMTAAEKAGYVASLEIEAQKKKRLIELNTQLAKAPDEQKGRIQALIDETSSAYDQAAEYARKKQELNHQELSFYDNMQKAAEQWKENQGTVNTTIQSGMLGVLNTLDSALYGFISNTKQSFKDLAVSVLKQIAVMLAKMALLRAAQAAVGMFNSPASGTGAGVAAAGSLWGAPIPSAKGNAFTGTGIAKFAKGGTFTNSVVNRTTPIQFAQGGTFASGVIGEAGPEAVMPLTRTASGNLGVETTGSGGTQNNVSVQVNMNSNGSTTATTTTSDDAKSAKALGDLIARKVQEGIAEAKRPGGILATR